MMPDVGLVVAACGVGLVHRRGARAVGGDGSSSWRFLAGLLAVLLAMAPRLEQAAEASFAWHMVQHQAFLLVAAPLLGSSMPLALLWRGFTGRRLPWASRGEPGVLALAAGAIHLAVLLAWHLPVAYDAALADLRVHALEHATLLGAASVMWWSVMAAARHDRWLGGAVVTLAATAIVGAGLGVVLLSSSTPLYGGYADTVVALDQQRVGGALMKVGTLLVHAGAAVWLTVRWLHRLADHEEPAGDASGRA